MGETSHFTRFIPVLTGNAQPRGCPLLIRAVHPRAYGERVILAATLTSKNGSSPCLRGTHEGTPSINTRLRFIPVLTGNALCSCCTASCTTVHPRAYGERVSRKVLRGEVRGSSPCLRGTHSWFGDDHLGKRFIPVLTGNAGTTRAARHG